ncbi:MAG: hypothetical protein HYU27_02870 [Acidobacteria bacterium]|nr:hypothetical protein [Acidobacteriota bacterium]
MMYCPRCNNTHWVKTGKRRPEDRLAILRLKRPYKCIKCDRIQLGSIFLDYKWPKLFSRKKREKRSKADKEQVKCPHCGGAVRRSRRKGLERLLIFWRAYRCSQCDVRFLSFKFV